MERLSKDYPQPPWNKCPLLKTRFPLFLVSRPGADRHQLWEQTSLSQCRHLGNSLLLVSSTSFFPTWDLHNESWGLLNKTINIFYLLFFLTVSRSVGAIAIQKWLGKARASSYQDRSQLPRWKSVRNLCYPLISSRYCGGSAGPPPCKTVRLLRQTLHGELFPPSLLPSLQCITWKAKSPGLCFDRNAFP